MGSLDFMNLFKGAKANAGIYLTILAISLIAVIGVVALAIDAGHVYVAQLRLQRAVDSAAINAANIWQRHREEGKEPDAGTMFHLAEEFALKNLGEMFGGSAEEFAPQIIAALDTNPLPDNRTGIVVTGQLTVKTLLIHIIPGIQNFSSVRASGGAYVGTDSLYFTLVIDTSWWMGCLFATPANDRDTCKIYQLQNALYDFVDESLIDGDYVSLVTYDTFARRKFPLSAAGVRVTAATRTLLKNAIKEIWNMPLDPHTSLPPTPVHENWGHSNLFDGLRVALNTTEDGSENVSYVSRHIVVFSGSDPDVGWRDCQWQSAQAWCPGVFQPSVFAGFPGPTQPILHGLLLGVMKVDPSDLSTSTGCPSDSKVWYDTQDNLGPLMKKSVPTRFFNDREIIDGTSSESGGERFSAWKNYARPNVCSASPQYEKNEIHHAAINVADEARTKGIFVHTIAIGEEAQTTVPNDPYQNIDLNAWPDLSGRVVVRTNLMARIANSESARLSAAPFTSSCVAQYSATGGLEPVALSPTLEGQTDSVVWQSGATHDQIHATLMRLGGSVKSIERKARAVLYH